MAAFLIDRFEGEKPLVKLVGEDGNAFAIMGRVAGAWRRMGRSDIANEYTQRATAGSYDDLLAVTMAYITEQTYDGLDEEEDELSDGENEYYADGQDLDEEDAARWIGQAGSADEAEQRWSVVRMRGIIED